MLLKNTVKLLSAEKYPEIVTSSHYMLSDLYIPAEVNPENPNLERFENDDDEGSVYDDDEDLPNDGMCASAIIVFYTKYWFLENCVSVLDLDKRETNEKFRNFYKPPTPVTGNLEERCSHAIGHIAAGLRCLPYFNEKGKEETNRGTEEEASDIRQLKIPVDTFWLVISGTHGQTI